MVVDITDKTDVMRKYLLKKDNEELSTYHKLMFIYPMGRLRKINLDKTFEQERIPANARIIMIGEKTFGWDPMHKGESIFLFNNRMTANKREDANKP